MSAAAPLAVRPGDFTRRGLTLLTEARTALLAAAQDAVAPGSTDEADPAAQAAADERLADELITLAQQLRRRARSALRTAAGRAARRQQPRRCWPQLLPPSSRPTLTPAPKRNQRTGTSS